MYKLIAVAALAAVTTLPVLAASKDGDAAAAKSPSAAQSRQQSRMAACNKDAVGKNGDERKAFMKQCLSSKAAAALAERRKAARTAPR